MICDNLAVNSEGHLTFAGYDTVALAKKYGLLGSGGSDYHGTNKPDIRLGVGRGDLSVPMTMLDALKNIKNNRNLL